MCLDPFIDRGHAQALHPRASGARPMFAARIARLRSEGYGSDEDLTFLAAQEQFHRIRGPEQMAELDGISAGFSVDFADIWLHLHAGTLADLRGGASLEDGCSAVASGFGPDGPLVVKNRDLGAQIELVQVTQRHASQTGGLLVLGSLFAPSAYSSGMNGQGLALVDTHVGTSRHRVGWLRYLLMGHLLDRCPTLDAALEMIRVETHCGGGTLELVDRQGNAAAVELSANGAEIETGKGANEPTAKAMHFRSNHWILPGAADQGLPYRSPRSRPNSQNRLAVLRKLASDNPEGLSKISAKQAFSAHGQQIDPGDLDAEGRGLCQHQQARTLSCAIWSPMQSSLEWTDGPPCSTAWQTLTL